MVHIILPHCTHPGGWMTHGDYVNLGSSGVSSPNIPQQQKDPPKIRHQRGVMWLDRHASCGNSLLKIPLSRLVPSLSHVLSHEKSYQKWGFYIKYIYYTLYKVNIFDQMGQWDKKMRL